jgi:hypothetical protein
MTDLAPLVLTASVLTIILQIVLIILILDKKKKAKVVPEEKPIHHEIRETRKPRENENRFNRRPPPQDQRVKPAAPPTQNPDQMERSLRDINLRLKNAEHDQENERRRIKDNLGTQPQQKRNDFSRPRDRNEGFRRNDRQRQDFQQRPPAEVQKPIVREEMPIPTPQPPIPPVIQQKDIKPPISPIPINTIASVAPHAELKVKQPDVTFEIESEGIENTDNLQHGRKFAVKRRVLKAGEEENAGQPIEKQDSNEKSPSEENVTSRESNSSDEKTSDNPIRFGR